MTAIKEMPYSRPYCLHCYAPLEEFEGPGTHCPHCERLNLRVDTQTYWTKERRFRNIEELLKIAVGVLVCSLTALALFDPGLASGVKSGMGIGAPILLGVLLWDLARITRKRSVFSARIIWPIAGALFGLVGLLLYPEVRLYGSTQAMILVGIAFAIAFFGLLTPLTSRWWRLWRERHIASSQESHVQ